MDRKKFALIKYDHGERMSLTGARLIGLVVTVALALGSLFVFFPVSLVLGIVALVIAHQPKQLCLGPRYIICGKKILYYANIQRVTLDADQGQLVLKSSTGQVLVLEQDRFQTKARKPDKILANKEARFNKVAQKIVGRVRQASPGAVLTGVRELRATGS